jgi:hypothetical protein
MLALLRDRINCIVSDAYLLDDYGYEVGVIVDSSDDGVRWCWMDKSAVMSDWRTIRFGNRTVAEGRSDSGFG